MRAVVQVIQSCIPNVKDAKSMLSAMLPHCRQYLGCYDWRPNGRLRDRSGWGARHHKCWKEHYTKWMFRGMNKVPVGILLLK